MKTSLILIGGGGHCISCIDVIGTLPEFAIKGILELPGTSTAAVNGVPVIGTDDDIDRLHSERNSFLITLGFIKNPAPRVALFEKIARRGVHLPAIVSSRAYVSSSATIGNGTIVMHAALVNASATVGKNVIVNTGAVIEHGTVIGDHTHVSTGAFVNGDCRIGSRVFIGSNSVIANNVEIAPDTVIGAGSVVIQSIASPGTYVGNPARKVS